MTRIFIGLLVALLSSLPVAAADKIGDLVPDSHADILGPQHAKGLFIWSHGVVSGGDTSHSPTQFWASGFNDEGYDIYRFERRYPDLKNDGSKLRDAALKARAMGYNKVILGGQSAGAWASLEAAALGAPVDGVIAMAPAIDGVISKLRDPSVATANWQTLVDRLPVGIPIAIFLFAHDDYDVGGRATYARSHRGARNLLVIDKVPEESGHHTANSLGFAMTYGDCLHDWIAKGERNRACRE